MKIILKFVCLILFFFSTTVLANTPDAAPRTVRVGIFPMEPICFTNEGGEAQGLIPNIVRAALPLQEGWKVEFISGSWAQNLNRLQDGSLDLLPCVTRTPERATAMDFSKEAAFESWAQVCAPAHSEVETWDDLRNKTVAVMAGDINGDNFIKTAALLGIACRTKEYPTHMDVLHAVQTLQAEAGVIPNLFAALHATNHGLYPTTILFAPSPAFFAVKKGNNPRILRQLDIKLSAWKEDKNSIYYQSVTRWLGGSPRGKYTIPTWLWVVICGVSSAAILLFALNGLLQRQIRKKTGELRKSEERFSIAAEAAGIGVWDRDILHDRLTWDNRMFQLYGIQPDEFTGAYEAWHRGVHPDDRQRVGEEVAAAEAGNKSFDTEFRIIRADTGEPRDIRAFGKVIRSENGKPVRMIGVNYDITEQKADQQALRQKNNELERFNKAAVGRELRMIELKKEINALCRKFGTPEIYP